MVTRNFPPLTGGMERFNYQVFLALRDQYDVALCGPRGCGEFAAGNICYEFPATPAWRYVTSSLATTMRAASEFKPDMVYAGSGLAAIAALFAARRANAKCGICLYGLDLIAPNAIYQRLFIPAIKRFDFFFVISRHTAQLAIQQGIPESRIAALIYPGTELPDFSMRSEKARGFRNQYGLGSRPILLSAGRLSPRKGIVEFIENCLPEIVQHHPEVCFVIIGDNPTQGLGSNAAPNLKQRIINAIARLRLQEHVKLLGRCDDNTLSDAYFAADAFVFPVIDIPGDVEGFGMVAIEAAAHGTYTIAFASGGIPDAISDEVSGKLVATGDYTQFTQAVIQQLQCTNPEQAKQCRLHAEAFSWENFSSTIQEKIAAAF